MQRRNVLAISHSPYLQQHRDNPVAWQEWGTEVFEAARAEQMPVFLSIGYSTCYWCHVMAHECFEDQEVADALNANFVSIKLDREERPDIDQIYMDATVAMSGHGGWPMSVFLTPEGKPFFCGTYFPKDKFMQLLAAINDAWKNRRPEILESADKVKNYLVEASSVAAGSNEPKPEIFDAAFAQLQRSFDPVRGGFTPAPKFPPAMHLGLLMRYAVKSANKDAIKMVKITLDEIMRGGINDHLSGGFARYSTDATWTVPHFEKMLYDNALLAGAYIEAFQLSQIDSFREVAYETLAFMARELRDPNGGFYSALDAGAPEREGEYYVWSKSEIAALLTGEEFDALKRYFILDDAGNFEGGKIVLRVTDGVPWEDRNTEKIQLARVKLLAARAKRERPHCDTKILTEWNGLAISAFCKAYQAFGEVAFLEVAEKATAWIKRTMWREGVLYRRWYNGEVGIPGCAEDYSNLIEAVLHLYECNFDEAWLSFAEQLQAMQNQHLWQREKGAYRMTSDEALVVERFNFSDQATPSGNSTAVLNNLRLHSLTRETAYLATAKAIAAAVEPMLNRSPVGHAKMLHALDYLFGAPQEIAIIEGKYGGREQFVQYIHSRFLPNKVLAVAEEGATEPALVRDKVATQGSTTVYVCSNHQCQRPVRTLEDLKALL